MADATGKKTGGRKKGTPNKITALLRDDILQAAADAHPQGRLGYLTHQAQENPTAFMTLLGKVLPTEVKVEGDSPVMFAAITLAPLVADDADD